MTYEVGLLYQHIATPLTIHVVCIVVLMEGGGMSTRPDDPTIKSVKGHPSSEHTFSVHRREARKSMGASQADCILHESPSDSIDIVDHNRCIEYTCTVLGYVGRDSMMTMVPVAVQDEPIEDVRICSEL